MTDENQKLEMLKKEKGEKIQILQPLIKKQDEIFEKYMTSDFVFTEKDDDFFKTMDVPDILKSYFSASLRFRCRRYIIYRHTLANLDAEQKVKEYLSLVRKKYDELLKLLHPYIPNPYAAYVEKGTVDQRLKISAEGKKRFQYLYRPFFDTEMYRGVMKGDGGLRADTFLEKKKQEVLPKIKGIKKGGDIKSGDRNFAQSLDTDEGVAECATSMFFDCINMLFCLNPVLPHLVLIDQLYILDHLQSMFSRAGRKKDVPFDELIASMIGLYCEYVNWDIPGDEKWQKGIYSIKAKEYLSHFAMKIREYLEKENIKLSTQMHSFETGISQHNFDNRQDYFQKKVNSAYEKWIKGKNFPEEKEAAPFEMQFFF